MRMEPPLDGRIVAGLKRLRLEPAEPTSAVVEFADAEQ